MPVLSYTIAVLFIKYTGTLCRVDAVYGDTLKIASGLGHTAKQNEENNRDESSQDNEDDNQVRNI
jgi:hypothetical protein